MDLVLADVAVSVTELKRNFAGIMREAAGHPVVILNHNRPEAYLVPAAQYERMMSLLEDIEDTKLVLERRQQPTVKMDLDEL